MAKKCLSKKSPNVKHKHSKVKSGGGKKPKVGSPKVGECKGAKKSSLACKSKMTPKHPKSRSNSSKNARNVAQAIVEEMQNLFVKLGLNLNDEKKEHSKSSKKSKEFFEVEVTTNKIKGSKSTTKFPPLPSMSPTKQDSKPHSKPKTTPKKKSAKSKKKSKQSKKTAKSPSEKATSKKEASKKH